MQLLQTDTILSKEEFSERNDPMSLYENIMAAMLLLVWAGSRGEDVRIQQKRQFCSEQVSFPFFLLLLLFFPLRQMATETYTTGQPHLCSTYVRKEAGGEAAPGGPPGTFTLPGSSELKQDLELQ